MLCHFATNKKVDGGGIRGLCSLFILRRLMSIIREIEESFGTLYSAQSLLPENKANSKEKRRSETRLEGVFLPCHYFDYITGTSTGGRVKRYTITLWVVANDVAKDHRRYAWTIAVHHRGGD